MLMVPCRGCKAIHRSGVDYDHRMLYGDWRDYHEWPDQKRSCPMCSRTDEDEPVIELPDRPYKAMTFAEFGRIAERMERRFDAIVVDLQEEFAAQLGVSECDTECPGCGAVNCGVFDDWRSRGWAFRPDRGSKSVPSTRLDEALEHADGLRKSVPFWARSDPRFDYVEGWAASVRTLYLANVSLKSGHPRVEVEAAIHTFVVAMLGEQEE